MPSTSPPPPPPLFPSLSHPAATAGHRRRVSPFRAGPTARPGPVRLRLGGFALAPGVAVSVRGPAHGRRVFGWCWPFGNGFTA